MPPADPASRAGGMPKASGDPSSRTFADNMTLSYKAPLEDVTQPSLRVFFRSRSARDNQIKSTIIGAVFMAAAGCYIARRWEPTTMLIAGLAGAFAGALLNCFTYKPTATRRIRKYTKRETEGRILAQTTYFLKGDRIECECLDVIVSFSLSDLESVTEDSERLELYFGSKGLCTIPLRAFSSDVEKSKFIEKVKCEQTGPANRRPSGTSGMPPADSASRAGSAPKASGGR